MTVLLEVQNLVKHFHVDRRTTVFAVNDVSIVLNEGETLGLVGESGSGKTTVGRCILRTIEATSGQIFYRGQDILSLSDRAFRRLRPKLQMVFQDPFDSLDPRVIVGEVIREPLRRHLNKEGRGQNREAQIATVRELARKVGLSEEQLEHLPRELSAGQQQRVGIARAIATNPDVIVLDEAVSNLDPSARFEIIEVLKRLQEELGLAYIFISHDLNTVRYMAERVAVMYLGKIVEVGPSVDVFKEQLHPYSRALLSAALFPDPTVKLSTYSLTGEIPSPTVLPEGCYLHPRCPEAIDACRIGHPPMLPPDAEHLGSCFWVDPTTFPGPEEVLARDASEASNSEIDPSETGVAGRG